MLKRALVGVVISCLLLAPVLADTITKTDGTVVEGTIVKEDDESVTIKCKLGEVKIARSEIHAVEKGEVVDVDAAIVKLKAETAAKLEPLIGAAEKSGAKDKAKQLREIMNQVTAWSLKAPQKDGSPAPAASGGLEWDDVCDRLDEFQRDQGLTELQRANGLKKYGASITGKVCRFSGAIQDVRVTNDRYDQKTGRNVTDTIVEMKGARRSLTIMLGTKEDVKKFENAGKGTEVIVEGPLNADGSFRFVKFVSVKK